MVELLDSGPAALWVVAGVLVLFFLKSLLESFADGHARRQRTQMLETALRAEIAANSEALMRLADAGTLDAGGRPGPAMPPPDRVICTRIYDAHFDELAGLREAIVAKAVAFYTGLKQVDAVRASLFAAPEAGTAVFRNAAREVARLGQETLHLWEIHAPLRKMA